MYVVGYFKNYEIMIEIYGIAIILIIGFVKISWTLDDIKIESRYSNTLLEEQNKLIKDKSK